MEINSPSEPSLNLEPKPTPIISVVGYVWLFGGITVLATFFMPLYELIGNGVNGFDLIRALDKDMADVARFIGTFSTFMMYFSVVFGMGAGVYAIVLGILALTKGTVGNWVVPVAISGLSFVFCLFTNILLSNSSDGPSFLRLDKFKPDPAIGFWLFAIIHLTIAALVGYWGATGKFKQPEPKTILGHDIRETE